MSVLRPENIDRSRSIRVYGNNLKYHINMGFQGNKLFASWEDFTITDSTGFNFIRSNYNEEIISFTSDIFLDVTDFDQTGFTTVRDDYQIVNPLFYMPHIRSYE